MKTVYMQVAVVVECGVGCVERNKHKMLILESLIPLSVEKLKSLHDKENGVECAELIVWIDDLVWYDCCRSCQRIGCVSRRENRWVWSFSLVRWR